MAQDKLKSHYKFLIVGGGIVGAGVFRDLALHGQEVLLVDAHDFASQTSQSSSKMLHGGIRYLENYDFALVEEALHEKNLWLKLAPHITRERAFFLPNYKESKYPLWMLKIGLFTYDLLSGFQNSRHKILGKEDTLKALKGLKSEGLNGSGVYFDAIVDDSKLALECIYDGLMEENTEALNYTKVLKTEFDGKFYQVELEDTIDKSKKSVTCEYLIFATGPFTDQLLPKLNIPWESKLLPSKGSHLWLDTNALDILNPLVLQTKDDRVVFVIPQRKAILVGTTEIPLKPDEDFFNIKPDQTEIDYLVKTLNDYFPEAKINQSHILSSFSGVRPLVRDGHDSKKTSRKHEIFEPQKNTFVLIGGKYTTFRVMASDLCAILMRKIHASYNSTLTLNEIRRPSLINNAHNLELDSEQINWIIKNEKVRTFEDLIQRRLSIPSKEHWQNEENFDDIFGEFQKKL